jgi:hypothetical protein
MTRAYRTTIEVALDRHATLQLPDDFPAGRAWIVVESQQPPTPDAEGTEADEPLLASSSSSSSTPDDDMEWWDELGEPGEPEDERARRAGSLALDV